MNCDIKSKIKLTSNIMLKSKYDKNPKWYIPYDLISYWANDRGLERFLSKQQVTQKYKKLFYAKNVRDEKQKLCDNDEINICENCVEKNICW